MVGISDNYSSGDNCSTKLELLLYLNRNWCSSNIGNCAHLIMANTVRVKSPHNGY